jgi:hypothetical protein
MQQCRVSVRWREEEEEEAEGGGVGGRAGERNVKRMLNEGTSNTSRLYM